MESIPRPISENDRQNRQGLKPLTEYSFKTSKAMIEKLLQEIRQTSDALLTDGTLQSERGNKAAGLRARKASLELERLTQAFREASLEVTKLKKYNQN